MARKPAEKSKKTSSATTPSVAPAAERKTTATMSASTLPQKASAEKIQMLAYLKWEASGRPPGDGVLFWLEAEREMNQSK